MGMYTCDESWAQADRFDNVGFAKAFDKIPYRRLLITYVDRLLAFWAQSSGLVGACVCVGGGGVTSFIWYSIDVLPEYPPFSALPDI